jgi:hypothetical protein
MGSISDNISRISSFHLQNMHNLQAVQYREHLLISGGKYADEKNLDRYERGIL